MKLKRRLFSGLCAAIVACAYLPAVPEAPMPAAAAGDNDLLCQTFTGTNIGAYDYSRWASTIQSALVPVSSGWMRVQGDAGNAQAAAEFYDADFRLQSRTMIDLQLPVWGGFHAGADGNYYIVTGQKNPDHSDGLNVLDIAKYDSSWKLLKHTSVKETDVAVPFDAGTMRCTDDGKWLIVRMGREMYSGHQACLSLIVKMADMTVTDNSEKSNAGYVSHSFNQFALLDNNHIIMLDHGDAYPRSVVMQVIKNEYTEGTFPSSSLYDSSTDVNLVTYPAASDSKNMSEVNYTGTSVGGFVQSSTHYIAAYNSIDQTKFSECWQDYGDPYTRNIMIAAVPKNSLKNESVSRYQVTNYADGEKKGETPFIVPLAKDSFAVMWQQGSNVNYTTVDGKGKPSGSISSFAGSLSDCTPVLKNGKLYWYTWKNETVTFYSLDTKNPAEPVKTVYQGGHDYLIVEEADENGLATLECTKCGLKQQMTVPTRLYTYWNSSLNETSTSKPPQDLDAGTTLQCRVYISAPSNPDEKSVVAEITEGAEYISETEPVDTGIIYSSVRCTKDYIINQFDPESVTCTVRVYPKYNPKAYTDYTITLKHTYETQELLKPTAEKEGYIVHTCTGCGHTYKEILPKLTALSDPHIKVTAADEDCVYNGTEFTPAVTVALTHDDGTETKLQEGTDYSAVYSDNVNAGSGTVTLTALDSSLYVDGETTASFTIRPQQLSARRITIASNTGQDPEKVFAPDFTIADEQNKTLTPDTDYTFAYEDNVLSVTGKGNYTGTVTKEFTPRRLSLISYNVKFADAELNTNGITYYTGSEQEPEVILYDDTSFDVPRVLRKGIDYEVTYQNNVNVGTARITITGIGAYQGTKSTSFRIRPLSLGEDSDFTAELAEEGPFVYANQAYTPKVVVKSKDGSKTLVADTDYYLSYQSNKNAGTARVYIYGQGNYTGSFAITFTIEPFEVTNENCTLSLEYESCVYDG